MVNIERATCDRPLDFTDAENHGRSWRNSDVVCTLSAISATLLGHQKKLVKGSQYIARQNHGARNGDSLSVAVP